MHRITGACSQCVEFARELDGLEHRRPGAVASSSTTMQDRAAVSTPLDRVKMLLIRVRALFRVRVAHAVELPLAPGRDE
jgi:hypothetical protein